MGQQSPALMPGRAGNGSVAFLNCETFLKGGLHHVESVVLWWLFLFLMLGAGGRAPPRESGLLPDGLYMPRLI
jgi:hypothetical protein